MTKALDKNRQPTGFTLGRKGFAQISAVEGIRLSAEMERKFAGFDRDGLSAPQRRQAIARDFGKTR